MADNIKHARIPRLSGGIASAKAESPKPIPATAANFFMVCLALT